MAAGRQLTDQQHRAITARGVSVALSAGAGCGKTFVLTERFLAQLQPPPNAAAARPKLGQLVALTFTERAAREMRDRIRAACTGRLLDAPDDQVDYWRQLIRELDGARISTIHSFCGSLLRSHAVEARLDPQFRVLDQPQADTVLFELLDEELHQRLAERDEAVIELVVQFGLGRLREMIGTLLRLRQEIDWQRWSTETPEALSWRWETYHREVSLGEIIENVAQSSPARTVLEIARRHVPTNPQMQQRCELLLSHLGDLSQSRDPAAELALIRENAKVQGGGGKKAWASEAVYDTFRNAATKLRDAVKKAETLTAFDGEASRPAAETALRLLHVTAEVAQAYQKKKQELAALDFNDLLIHAGQLLLGPEREGLRKQLSSQIRLLLVDEFQDTDPLQVELVKALCHDALAEGKLFFVGDYKQSIYRFRGADPHVFRQLRQAIPEAGRLPLSLNFRSQPAILDFVNALFEKEFGPEYDPLRPHRPQLSPTPAIELLWAPDDNPGQRPGQEERLRRREADWIARRIRTMLDSAEKIIWDDEPAEAGRPATRAVRPGDVALLFRALSNVEYYEEALRRWGIDYYLVGGHAFYAQQEIYDLLNLLRALKSPCDQVSLAGVLRSPMFGLADETLYHLASHPHGLSAALHADELPEELDDQQRSRVCFAAATLAELRAIKDCVPIAQLIGQAMERTGYDAALLAEFLGERKLANLQKLIEQARSFDRAGIFTLADFITQLAEFVVRQPDEPLAATHPESSNVVRLMTIHQAKGLEFPVVVVPDVDRRKRSASASVAFTPRLGPMVREPQPAGGFDLHALSESRQQQAELTRLLYVATTRAADYLILSAGVPQLGSARGPWTELIHRRFDPLSGMAKDDSQREIQLRVTTTEPSPESTPSGIQRRRDLQKTLDKARQMAQSGAGRIPQYLNPVPVDSAARRQYSFSRLSGKLHARQLPREGDPQENTAPPELDPRGLGTLVHAVLAEIEFSNPADVSAEVRRHAQRHFPEAESQLDEPIEMIRRFLDSPRAGQIAAATEFHAELEFLLAWPLGRKDPGGRYLQGFIDALYQDTSGGWHVIDYKTNRVTAASIDAVATDYEMQMLVYALAVERILGRPPVELTLCFLRPGVEHHFPWDDTARQRVADMVNRGICQ